MIVLNQKFIKRRLSMMTKDEFEELVPIVLKASSGLVPVCVDGTNDGGVDYALYEGLKKTKVAVQTTDTWRKIENKIKKNVLDVADRRDISAYYYIVKEVVSNDVKERLEQMALANHHLMMKIMGGNEISDFIIHYGLQMDFARVAKLDSIVGCRGRIEQPEVWLHSYLMMSTDRRDFTNEMIDSTLKYLLYNTSPLLRTELIDRCQVFLRLPLTQKSNIEGRIDSMMMTSTLLNSDNGIRLSEDENSAIDCIVADYEAELIAMSNICSEIIGQYSAERFALGDEKELATLLARCYIEHYCKVLRDADYMIKVSLFNSDAIASAAQQLRAMLLKCNVSSERIDQCFAALVTFASRINLVKRLAQSVVYVALRELSDKKSPAVFNTDDWSKISVFIDASVLMPYLASKMFDGNARYNAECRLSVDEILSVGCNCKVPYEYVEECASHLIAATWFAENQEGFEDDMALVPNAYVSAYFKMKNIGIELPDTLQEFLKLFCEDIFVNNGIQYEAKYAAIRSLSALLSDYNIKPIKLQSAFDESDLIFSRRWEEYLKTKKKDARLLRHDVSVLRYLRHQAINVEGRNVLLTWDSSLLQGTYEMRKDVWIVSPVNMADLICVHGSANDYDLMSFSHAIASVIPPTKEMAFGRILERVVNICKNKKMDWKCRQEILRLKHEFFERFEAQSSENQAKMISRFEEQTVKVLSQFGYNDDEESAKDDA